MVITTMTLDTFFHTQTIWSFQGPQKGVKGVFTFGHVASPAGFPNWIDTIVYRVSRNDMWGLEEHIHTWTESSILIILVILPSL